MTKEKKLADGWQLGFAMAACFMFTFVCSYLKILGLIKWSWWIITIPTLAIPVLIILFIIYAAVDIWLIGRSIDKDINDITKLLKKRKEAQLQRKKDERIAKLKKLDENAE